MFNLLMKEFIVQKKTVWFALFYSVFVFAAFYNTTFRGSSYIMGSLAVAYLLLMNANAWDDKNKCEIVLNSLPIPRRLIVEAKYISVLVFMAFGLVLTGLAGGIVSQAAGMAGLEGEFRLISITDVVAVFISLVLLVSAYYPLYFRFGYNFARKANMILFMLIFFGPGTVVGYLRAKEGPFLPEAGFAGTVQGASFEMIGALAVAIVVIVALASFLISVKIYNNREF